MRWLSTSQIKTSSSRTTIPSGKSNSPSPFPLLPKFAQKLASQRVEDLNAMVVGVTDKYLFPTRSDPSGFIKLPITFPKVAPSSDKLTSRRVKNLDPMVVRVADNDLFPKNGDIMGNWNCREEEKDSSSGGGEVGEQTGEGEADMTRRVKNMSFSKCYSQQK